ncbi:MAG: histidine phosphatase family protein [Lachnospiraceae bacterium]|nr:histidine phosphatase family protein [Lachnospiraceae bacterium]
MRLIIVRHGESEGDVKKIHEGRADLPLTEKGLEQSKQVADFLKKNYKINAVYSSTLERAKKTGEIIAKECGLDLIEEPMLMEFNNGHLAGLSYDDAAEKYPDIRNLPVYESVYGQESLMEFRQRADVILARIMFENKHDDTVVVVSHSAMINQLFRSFMMLNVDSDVILYTGETGVHEWLVTDRKKLIVMTNYQQHLGKYE